MKDDTQITIELQKKILQEQCRLYDRMKRLSDSQNSLCHVMFNLAQKHETDASK